MGKRVRSATSLCSRILKREGEGVKVLIRRTLFAIASCVLSLLSGNLLAQGCASCYTTAAAGGSQTAHALRSGILLLVFPPTLIFVGIIVTLQRWRKADRGLSIPTRQFECCESEEIE